MFFNKLLGELKEQTVEGHPKSVLYKLLIGPRTAARDRINAAYTVADFFLMDFASAGTNFPHHHETAEEIYLVLDGEGQWLRVGEWTELRAYILPNRETPIIFAPIAPSASTTRISRVRRLIFLR